MKDIRIILFTCTVSPYRIAFMSSVEDSIFLYVFEILIDFSFIIDLLLTFFTAYYDLDDNLITRKKVSSENPLRPFSLFHFLDSNRKSPSITSPGGSFSISSVPFPFL